jgi:tripartite-type tricarboxylate transporter receptor subunit TctC
MNRREAMSSVFAAAVATSVPKILTPQVARAQAGFPNRAIRIIVPVAPGGGVDVFARLIAAKISSQRDVSFVVENRTGGKSTVGGLDVQRAAPDGYTVLFHASTHNLARLVMREVPYDPVTDFTPIALAGEAPLIHIIANTRPQQTLKPSLRPPKRSLTTGRSRPRSSARRAISRGGVQSIDVAQRADRGLSRHRAGCE